MLKKIFISFLSSIALFCQTTPPALRKVTINIVSYDWKRYDKFSIDLITKILEKYNVSYQITVKSWELIMVHQNQYQIILTVPMDDQSHGQQTYDTFYKSKPYYNISKTTKLYMMFHKDVIGKTLKELIDSEIN